MNPAPSTPGIQLRNAAKEWVDVGTFDAVTVAARRIRELEGYPASGVFLEFHVDTVFGTDEEALSVFDHTDKRAFYGIRRSRPN
jgi:hypothetical protein